MTYFAVFQGANKQMDASKCLDVFPRSTFRCSLLELHRPDFLLESQDFHWQLGSCCFETGLVRWPFLGFPAIGARPLTPFSGWEGSEPYQD